MRALWDPAVADDPLAFVRFAFPWGVEGSALAAAPFDKPRAWQVQELEALSASIKTNRASVSFMVHRASVCKGRGVGGSALAAWLTLWMMSTRPGSTVIVTANKEEQLVSRTWPELRKWLSLSIMKHWFVPAATSVRPADWLAHAMSDQLGIDSAYWYAAAQLWKEENPDAFAGVHNLRGVLVIFDEASGIPQPIWQVTEGFFTDPTPDRYWFVFSNGRRNEGPFFECFHRDRDRWRRTNVDSRDVEGTDPAYLQGIVTRYGEDSDEARVEVRGLFPRTGDDAFMSREAVELAVAREVEIDAGAPLVMGVDVARFGSDSTVFAFRQGRDARTIPFRQFKGLDTMEVASHVMAVVEEIRPDAVCVESSGVGAGVADRLKRFRIPLVEVDPGSSSSRAGLLNKRVELWTKMKEWVEGGCLPRDQELVDDLCSPRKKFIGQSDTLALEAKDDLRRRGLHSPDRADALACTFAVTLPYRDAPLFRRRRGVHGAGGVSGPMARDVDYNMFR